MARQQRMFDPLRQGRLPSAWGKDAEDRPSASFDWADGAEPSFPKRHSTASTGTHQVQLSTPSLDGVSPSHPGSCSSSLQRASETFSQGVTSASVTSNPIASTKRVTWYRKSRQSKHRRAWQGAVPSPVAVGLPRWVVLLLYCLYCVFSGPAYINWTPIADVLFKAGAFEWRCTNTDATTSPGVQSANGMARCEDQEAEVNRLFTITAASHFFFSFIGGSLLDLVGPKITALVGLGFGISGWVLLGFANRGFQAYIPGCLLIGAGLDTTYFPLLSGANLFPGHVATVKAVFGASLSFSFLVPIVFRAIYFRPETTVAHSTIFVCFAGICLGISLLIALFVIPWRPWPAPYTLFGQQQRDQPLAGGCGLATQSGDRLAPVSTSHEQLDELLTVPRAELSQDGENPPGACTSLVAVAVRDLPKEEKPCTPAVFPATEKKNGADDCFSRGVAASPPESSSWKTKLRRQLKSCQRDFCSLVFIPIVPFFCVVLTGVVFFIPSARHLMPDAYAANRIIQIFSFVPCPLFGHIADVWGIMPVMYICNVCGLLSFSLVMIPGIPAAPPLQYAASLLAASQLSFLVCQICCYVAETFDEENQGKLIGFLCCMAGLTSLSAHPIMDYSVRYGFRSALLAFVGSSCFNVLLLVFVHWQKKKMGRLPQRTSEIKRQLIAAASDREGLDGPACQEDRGREQEMLP